MGSIQNFPGIILVRLPHAVNSLKKDVLEKTSKSNLRTNRHFRLVDGIPYNTLGSLRSASPYSRVVYEAAIAAVSAKARNSPSLHDAVVRVIARLTEYEIDNNRDTNPAYYVDGFVHLVILELMTDKGVTITHDIYSALRSSDPGVVLRSIMAGTLPEAGQVPSGIINQVFFDKRFLTLSYIKLSPVGGRSLFPILDQGISLEEYFYHNNSNCYDEAVDTAELCEAAGVQYCQDYITNPASKTIDGLGIEAFRYHFQKPNASSNASGITKHILWFPSLILNSDDSEISFTRENGLELMGAICRRLESAEPDYTFSYHSSVEAGVLHIHRYSKVNIPIGFSGNIVVEYGFSDPIAHEGMATRRRQLLSLLNYRSEVIHIPLNQYNDLSNLQSAAADMMSGDQIILKTVYDFPRPYRDGDLVTLCWT